MFDDWDWNEDARLDALLTPYVHRSFPPGLLAAHIARKKAMHAYMAREIDKLIASTKGIPTVVAKPYRGL